MSQITKSLGNKVVLAKIPREEYTRFQQYCDMNDETVNSFLRRINIMETGFWVTRYYAHSVLALMIVCSPLA